MIQQATPARRFPVPARTLLPLAIVAASAFTLYEVARVQRLLVGSAQQGQIDRIARQGLPLVEGPVLVARSGGKATVLATLHPRAGVPEGDEPVPNRVVRITVPSEAVEATGFLYVGSRFAEATEVDVTEAATGAPLTFENLGGRTQVSASKVRILGSAAYTDD